MFPHALRTKLGFEEKGDKNLSNRNNVLQCQARVRGEKSYRIWLLVFYIWNKSVSFSERDPLNVGYSWL